MGRINANGKEEANHLDFRVKRKKENGFSFYALHSNQLLSEVLFSIAGFVPKKLSEALRFLRLCV